MATLTKGATFSTTETITNAKLHNLVDNGSVSGIVNADIDTSAGIVDSKLDTISTPGKVNTSALSTGSDAQGDILYHNGTAWVRLAKGTAKHPLKMNAGATAPEWGQVDLTAGVTGILPKANGGNRIMAWVGTSANPITKDDGYNIDGTVTKNGTGDYTITWDTDFANADYAVFVTAGGATMNQIDARAVGSVRIKLYNKDGNNTDVNPVCVMAVGDQ